MSNNVQILISAQDTSTQTLEKVANALKAVNVAGGSVSTVFEKIGAKAVAFSAIAFATEKLNDGMRALTATFVGYNAKLEQTRIGLATMIGDRGAANLFIQQMKEFAAVTPFEFEDVDKAAKKFMAFGWEVQNIIPDLTAVGNASAALGIGSEGIDRITLALGQMSIKAHVSGEEVRQLNEAGIGAQKYLADAFNLTSTAFDDLSKTGISGVQAVRAIIAGMANDPKFKNMMEQQSKTMIGFWSTLKDTSKEIFGAIGTNIFDFAKSSIERLADMTQRAAKTLRENGMAAALGEIFSKEWADRIWRAGGAIEDFVEGAQKAGGVMVTALSPVAGAVWDIALGITENLAPAFISLAEHGDALTSVIWGVTAALVALKTETLLVAAASIIAKAETIALTASYVAEAVALGEIGLAMSLLAGPAGWAALAIGGLTAAIVYWASDKNMGDATTAADNYVGNFDQVGDAAETAANKVHRLTREQAAYFNQQSGIGGEFEDFASRQKVKLKDEAEIKLKRAGGTPAITPGMKQSEVDKLENQTQKMAEMVASLKAKTLDETGTALEVGTAKLTAEVTKMQNDINDALKAGADVSGAQGALNKYKETMIIPLQRAWTEAWQNIKNQTALATAQITGDKKAQAQAEYDIAVTAIKKEYEERKKAIMVDKIDTEAAAAADLWLKNQMALADKALREKNRQDRIDEFDQQIETNNLLLESHLKTKDEVDIANRQILENKLIYLATELKGEKLTADEIIKIRQQVAQTTTKKDETPVTTKEALKSGLKDSYESFGTWATNMKAVGNKTAIALRDSFADFFFDAMTGKLKKLSEYFTSFFQGIAKAVSEMMANMFAKQVMSSMFPSMFKTNATGGPVEYGVPRIIGENGPELFIPQAAGRIVPNSDLKSGGAGNVRVNIVNQTGSPIQEAQTSVEFDLEETVLSIVLKGVSTNKYGMQDVIGAVARR